MKAEECDWYPSFIEGTIDSEGLEPCPKCGGFVEHGIINSKFAVLCSNCGDGFLGCNQGINKRVNAGGKCWNCFNQKTNCIRIINDWNSYAEYCKTKKLFYYSDFSGA